MSYFDAYKKRLKVDNIGDSFKLDTIDNTIREFKNNPSYMHSQSKVVLPVLPVDSV